MITRCAAPSREIELADTSSSRAFGIKSLVLPRGLYTHHHQPLSQWQAYIHGHDHSLYHIVPANSSYHQYCSGAGSKLSQGFLRDGDAPFQRSLNGEGMWVEESGLHCRHLCKTPCRSQGAAQTLLSNILLLLCSRCIMTGFIAVEVGSKRMTVEFIGLESEKPLYTHVIHQ